jgi:hypothetical protein
MKNETTNKVVVAVGKTIKGSTFIGVNNYSNKQGEVSNQLMVSGITYENCLVNDFNALQEKQNEVFDKLTKEHNLELIGTAYKKVFDSLEKRLSSDEVKEKLRLENDTTIKRSDAQIDAYEHLAKGIKRNKETNEIHVFGLVVRKKVVTAIEYKETKSAELTIIQNKIKKLCEFKQSKYRTFVFNNGEFKMQGITL